MPANAIHHHFHLPPRTVDICLGDIFHGPAKHYGWLLDIPLRRKLWPLEMVKLSCLKLFPCFWNTCEVHVICRIVLPTITFFRKRKNQKIVGRSSTYFKIYWPEVNHVGRDSFYFDCQQFQRPVIRWARRKAREGKRYRPTL